MKSEVLKPIYALGKGGHETTAGAPLRLAAIGLEAEFNLLLDGRPVRPEKLFRDPRDFIRGPLVHRQGTSYHVPTGGAVYFDTGVIEVATPVIEIAPGCAARAGRSLWESILLLRRELDAWQARDGRQVRLAGFSTHYNVSFERSGDDADGRTVEQLALLLAHILPLPVMLLAANRRSTGIGVRPRGDRIEITADFTPSAALMIAAATLITAVVREVMTWPSYDLDVLADHGLPRLAGFAPMPHTSRKGWLARHDCFPRNPFDTDVDAAVWAVEGDDTPHSLRQLARTLVQPFHPSLRRLADPFTRRLLFAVLSGEAPSLLDLDDRPDAYEDVGRLCLWDNLFPERTLSRSRYERVLIRAISGLPLHLGGHTYLPVGLRGWTEVVFRRRSDGARHAFAIDYLLDHLDDWERAR